MLRNLCTSDVTWTVQSSSVQMVSMHSGRPICAPHCLWSFPNVAFETCDLEFDNQHRTRIIMTGNAWGFHLITNVKYAYISLFTGCWALKQQTPTVNWWKSLFPIIQKLMWYVLLICLIYLFIHFTVPFGKFRPPYLGKATAAARATLPNPAGACWVFSCFRNPPNSDMDYRIFYMRTRSFLCVRIHTGDGHTDSESAQHFDSEKTQNLFLCSWQAWTSGLWISSLTLYQLSHPVTHLSARIL